MGHVFGFDTLTFCKGISEIPECECGEFLRAANCCLNSLRSELSLLQNRNIDQRLDQMQMYLQEAPQWEIISTKQRLSIDIQYLDDLLCGHDQDWESASSTFVLQNASAVSIWQSKIP